MKGLGFVEDRQSVNMGRQLNLSRKKKIELPFTVF